MMLRSSGENGFLLLATVLRAGAALAALILLLAASTFAPAIANAQEPTPTPATVIRVDPPAQNVSAGTGVVVDIRIDNVSDLAAYEFEIQYTPNVLTYVSVTNGAFLGSSGRSVTCLPAQFGPGTVRYGCVTFGTSPAGPSGSGVLARLVFSTSCAGSSPLAFTLASLGDALGIGLPSQTQDGSATVTGGGACPTPTVTSTPGPASPTPSPTPTATATSTGPPPTPVPQLCAAAAGPAVCILPISQAAFTGEQVEIQVAVDNVANLGAFQFDLVFDSVLLSPISASQTAFIGSTGRSVVCFPALLADRVTLACSTLGTDPPGPNGSGILALVTLQAETAGFSTITLENSLLADITSARIAIASEQGGDVTIADAPTPTNTFTPTDTSTPTETATVPSPTPPATPTPGPVPETVVRIDPSAQNVGEGTDVVIDVVIESVTEMGAYDFTLAFDPSLLTFVDVTNSSFLGSSGGSVVCIGPTVDQILGSIGFGCFTTSATGVTGTGTIATIRLGTSCAGTGALALANISIANSVGGTIPSVAHDASVGVVGGTSCSPSATATATATPIATTTGPTPSTLVRVNPSSQGVLEGVDVVVDLVVEGVSDLGGYTFTLSYDPTLLTPIETLSGAFLESTGGTSFCLGPNVNPTAGTVQFGCTLTGAPGPDGTGVLASVRFATFCGGSSGLAITQLSLADSAGSPIATASQNGSATVIGSTTCPTPVPTPTPTPTNTPTLPAPTPSTNVHFNPSSQGVTEDADVVFNIEIDGVANLGAYQFTLAFDPTLFTFGSITNGPFLASTGGGVNCIGPDVDPIAGTAAFGCVMNSAPGISGSGVLANVRLGTFCTGSDVLELSSLEIADAAGLPIPAASQPSNVTVLGATTCPTPASPTDTPTATPTGPTATPTATPTPPACNETLAFTVCLQPADQTIAQGNDAVYEIAIANSPELGAFQVTLTFDAAIASVSTVDPGTFLSSTLRLVTCLAPAVGPGIIQYVCVSLQPDPAGPTGSGVLAFLTLTGDSVGLTSLTLQDVILTDIGGLAHPAPALEGGSLSVSVAPTFTPSSTPTTTLSPTPSDTPTPTLSPTPCPGGICPTATDTPTPTDTPIPTDTPTATSTATPTPAIGPITMRIEPTNQTVGLGTFITVDVIVENVTDLGAFQFRLDFSPAVTSFQSVLPGPFLGSTGRSLVCPPAIIGTGFVDLTCATIGSTVPGPDGSGVIATITYLTLAEGLSTQHLSNPILTNISGAVLLPIVTQDGVIGVVPPSTATPLPTATLTPTATPGSPSLSGFSPAQLRVAVTSGKLVVAYPDGTHRIVAPAEEPAAGAVAIAKEPSEANLFIGNGPLIIYERAYNIPDGPGLGGFELAILFDPNLVSLQIDAQPFLDALAGTDRTATCLTDLTEGEIRFGCVTTGSDDGPTGTFDLARVHVTPISGLPLRPAPGNGIEVILDDIAGNTHLSDTLGNAIRVEFVGDAKIIVRVLESDINVDCAVNVLDEQMVAGRFGVTKGSKFYETWFDLEPEGVADGDIDINDLQAVYGRHGSTCANPWQAQEPPTKATPTFTPSATPDETVTPAVTATPTPGGSDSGTPAETGTPTSTPIDGSTPTVTPLPTASPTITPTELPSGSGTPEPTETPLATSTATQTPDPDATATDTPVPGTTTATLDPEATVTATPVPASTETPTPLGPPTATPLPTATSTSTPADTATPVVIAAPTNTPVDPTSTDSPPSTAPPADDTDAGPPVIGATTPTTVSDVEPSTRRPVVGLPDTGNATDGNNGLSTPLAGAALLCGLAMLFGSQMLWWRRQRASVEQPFRLRFRKILTSNREDMWP